MQEVKDKLNQKALELKSIAREVKDFRELEEQVTALVNELVTLCIPNHQIRIEAKIEVISG